MANILLFGTKYRLLLVLNTVTEIENTNFWHRTVRPIGQKSVHLLFPGIHKLFSKYGLKNLRIINNIVG